MRPLTARWHPLRLNVIAYGAFVPPDFSRWIRRSNSGKHHAGPASLTAGMKTERKICHIETQEVGEHTPPKHVAITTNVIRSVCAWQVSKARDVGHQMGNGHSSATPMCVRTIAGYFTRTRPMLPVSNGDRHLGDLEASCFQTPKAQHDGWLPIPPYETWRSESHRNDRRFSESSG